MSDINGKYGLRGGFIPMVVKQIRVIGGANDSVWGSQYKQQDRIIDKKCAGYAINTVGYNGLIIKRYERNFSKRTNG